MKQININYKSKNVEVYIEKNLLKKLNGFIDNDKKYFILCDKLVFNLYGKNIKLNNMYFKVINQGEESKNISVVNDIISSMLESKIDKGDMLINFGGGVISDLGGFVASIYKRGIDYINIPTTLLSMVDASIGGKTAIDFNFNNQVYKNQIGSIYHPSKVIIDPLLLKTLDLNEYQSGLGEVIKYGFCFDEDLFYSLFGDFSLEDVIHKCIEIKAKITSEDEFDQGIRLSLNFGHTIGHAVEALTSFRIPHGICVLYGMVIETSDLNLKDLLIKIIEKLDIKFDFKLNVEDLKKYIIQDKKIINNYLRLPVIEKIGEVKIENIKIDDFIKRFV